MSLDHCFCCFVLKADSCRGPLLDFLDSEGRLSSDRIPQARLSKTTRFADAVVQQEAQLSGITTDALPGRQYPSKLQIMPSKISMLLVLTGVIISLQVGSLHGVAALHTASYAKHILGSLALLGRPIISVTLTCCLCYTSHSCALPLQLPPVVQ